MKNSQREKALQNDIGLVSGPWRYLIVGLILARAKANVLPEQARGS